MMHLLRLLLLLVLVLLPLSEVGGERLWWQPSSAYREHRSQSARRSPAP
jgi:hypothetical protein